MSTPDDHDKLLWCLRRLHGVNYKEIMATINDIQDAGFRRPVEKGCRRSVDNFGAVGYWGHFRAEDNTGTQHRRKTDTPAVAAPVQSTAWQPIDNAPEDFIKEAQAHGSNLRLGDICFRLLFFGAKEATWAVVRFNNTPPHRPLEYFLLPLGTP